MFEQPPRRMKLCAAHTRSASCTAQDAAAAQAVHAQQVIGSAVRRDGRRRSIPAVAVTVALAV
jgi:hypothetical protein